MERGILDEKIEGCIFWVVFDVESHETVVVF